MKQGIGRKLLSVVLAVMMLVSLLPTAAFAEESNNSAEPIVINDVADDSTTGNDTESTNEETNNAVDTTTYVAKIGENTYATLDEAITAVQNGETIVVNAGEYKLNGSLTYSGKAFTIKAADGAAVSFDMSAAVALHGAKITFNNVTFNYKTNGNYIGLQHTDTLVYNNCTINGMVFLYAVNETFNDCTFNQESADAYNVWTYGAQNVAFNGCTFNCVGKAVLVYNEGTNTKTDLTVKDTKFIASAPVEGKAAIEIDTHLMKGGATITVDDKTTAEGFATGSKSGSTLWNDKMQTADTNKNTTVTVAGETVFEPVATAAVAQIGETKYDTLDEALEYLVGLEQKDMQPTPEEYALTLLDESAWNTATPVYWAAGTQSGYAAKLTDALTAAYKENAGKITIVCRPGADVGTMTHGHVADDITIFGNKAYVSGGECDLEVDTYKYSRETGANTGDGSDLNGDISIIAFQLDNLGVWGQRHTTHTVNVALVDCDSVKNIDVQRVYISGTSGKNMIGVTDCDFKTANTAVYSNADGKVTVCYCTFEGSKAPVNINHKANDSMIVEVQDCTFTNCGDAGDWEQFAAPVRFVNSGSGTMKTGVQRTTFTDTVGSNGDILLGDGRTGQKSNDVSLYVSNTDANIQAQKPGYYNGTGTDATKKAATEVKSNETLDTSVETLLPAELEQPVPDGYQEDASGNVTISDEAGLFWFAKQANAGNNFAGKTVKLANNIALTKAWTPIGIYKESKTHFKGTFDGQNHTVSGVEVTENRTKGVGFFGKVYTGTIKNLTVEGTIATTNCDYVGGIVGHGYATISNCTFKGNVGSTNTMQVGGIAGSGGFTITNCSVYGNVTAECWAGGIVGNCQDGGAYTNCYVEGVISAGRTYWGGGAAGITPVPLYPSQVISSCYSNTVVKVAGEEVNCPIIAAYNNPLDYKGYTGDLKIYDNSWNKQKNSNDSYPIYAERDGVGGVLEEGKVVSRDNNLVMLEDDLQYVTDLSKVRIMAGSAVTQAQVDALAVASIGTAKYISLAAAIAAANNGDTVTLLKDVTENVEIAKEKNLTLDLNGKTLNGGTGTAKAALSNLGTITIQDTSADKTGTIKRDDKGTVGETSYYVIRNQGTMTIESGTVLNNSGYKQASSIGSMNGSSLICNGDCDEGGTLTINGGTFTQNNFIAIKNGALGVLHVTGGTITSNHSAIQNWFEADITGGEITGQLWTDAYFAGESVGQTTIGGDAKFTGEIVMDITGKVAPTLAINGGNLNVTNWRITSAAAKAGAKPAVSGGTFKAAVPAEYCAEGFIPTANADGTYGVKAGAYVAEVNGVKYETLQAAINAANTGDTITLLRDCESDRINLETKSITVDLNGKVLTSTAAYGVMFCAKNGHKITVKGTTAGSKLVGTLMVTAETDGRIEINGGTYESDKYCPIYINGAVSSENSKLTVKNATITALSGDSNQDNGVAVYLAGYSTSTFTKTTITAPVTGLEIRAGKLTLTNCTVTGGSGEVVTNANGNGTTVTNAAVAISQHTTKKNIDVTITGGTYTATAAVYQTNVQGTGSENVKVSIKSGTFKGAVSAETDNTVAVSGGTFSSAVPENCCADGYIPTKNEDSTYGVKPGTYVAETNGVKYESLQAAIDAAKRNATVTMLANTRENVTISTPYLTLDLNGFTLNGGTEKGKPALTVTARATVKDSSAAQTGTIMREDTAENSGVSSHYVIDVQGGGWLTFESGTVKNNSGNTEGKGASLVRVGDDSVAKYPGLNIKGGTFTQDNFIVIKVDRGDLFLNGGTLKSANSYAVENWFRATIKGGTVNGAVSSWTYSAGSKSTLTIEGGTVNGDVTSVNYGSTKDKVAKVSITGGTVNGQLDTRSYDPNTGELTSIVDAAMATIEVTGGTFDRDPTKYVVEGSTVKTNTDGTFGVEKAYLAKVGETSYYTMDEAFHAAVASGETLYLLRDYTTGAEQNSGSKSFAIDLGGHTWTYTGTKTDCAAFEINYPNVTLTVKNGTVVSNSMVGLIPSAMGGTITYDNAGLVFEDVTMTANGHSGIETNGNNTNDTVTLKNSTLNVPNGFGIYFPSSGTLTIDNSTINAKTMGVQVCAGSLSINAGSAITVTGDAVPKTENDGAIQDGAAISIVNRTGYKGLGDVTVTGGKFTAKTGNKAIKAYNWANKVATEFTANDKVAVSGGTFSSAVPAGLCATGYVPTAVDADGNYTVEKVMVAQIGNNKYGTLSEAIAAANAGDTVKLLRDINTPEISYMISKSLTIDLNGKTVTGDGYDAVFQINNADAKVLIKNGNIVAVENTGSAGKYAMAIWACKAECEVTLENLNASQKITHTDDPQMDMIYTSGGTIIINSGNFESGTPAWTLNCNDAAYKDGTANIIVKGGTFTGFDPANNKAEGENTNFVAAGYKSVDNNDGTYTVVKNENVVAVIGTKEYATLSEALRDAAKTGGTVLLVADVDANEDIVQVRAGVTLNLNGYSITNVDLLRVTGKIIDTATEKGIVSAEGYVIGGQNAYTPVYDSARKGYSFFNLSVVTKLEDGVFGGVYFWLNDETEKAEFTSAVALMRADTDGRRVKAVITFTWETKDYCGTQSYDYTDDFMKRYLNYKDMLGSFYVKAKGLDNIDSVTAQAKFVITDASGDALYTLAGSEITLK